MTIQHVDNKHYYKVVANHQEQYTLWPITRENPVGWRDTGHSGSKEACLAYITQVSLEVHPYNWDAYLEEVL